jgi:hypothetical protein
MQRQRDGLEPSNPLEDMRRASSFLVWAAFVWSAPIQLWLRQRFGSRYFGYHLYLGFFWAFAFGSFFTGQNPAWMVMFTLVSFGLMLMHADARRQLAKKGVIQHSGYSGNSRLPGTKAKTQWEPLLVLLIGCGCLSFNVPLGVYLLGGSLCLGIFHAAIEQRDNADRRAIRDALIEAEYREGVMQEERERMGK